MDYAKTLPFTGAGILIAGALGYWTLGLIVAVCIFVTAVLVRKFFPLGN